MLALGNVCSAIERLPTSAILSAGLEKHGNVAVASGGFTDIWRGEYDATQVAIKAFRLHPTQNLKEAKEVSMSSVSEIGFWTKFTDYMETGADVDEASP